MTWTRRSTWASAVTSLTVNPGPVRVCVAPTRSALRSPIRACLTTTNVGAFLSATKGEDGQPVHAISRIGNGPWYDRTGRVVAMNLDGLRSTRPTGGDAAIADDLPNEFGVPNHRSDPTVPAVDNHDTLTGSDDEGELDTNDMGDTCNDWTSKNGSTGVPRIGHSWPRSNNDGRGWISDHWAGGCAPGINVHGEGPPMPGDLTVGAGGGYGGIYCFALDP
jgi:hypothetical protein